MKITCQACAAKYTIADEKVVGKVVKIRCKKCGATIVVNGNDPSANAGGAAAEPAPAFDYAQPGQEQWTVNVADGDQRTMTEPEIAAAYQSGAVHDETFCWKDGMTDWLPLREIEQLHAACTATRVAPAGGMPVDEGATKIQDTGPALFGTQPPPVGAAHAAPSVRPAAGDYSNGGGYAAPAAAGAAAAAPAVAARRAGGRAPAADLFGGAAQAGGEDDVMTSAPAGMPQVHDDAQKLTGARNENSVLFSLNALTSKGGPGGPSMPATSEASGLIDIRQLSNQIGMGEEKKKRSGIDDIMNLAGGGAFSPAMNAPVLAAPPIEEYAAPADAPTAMPSMAAPAKSKTLIFVALGVGAFVVVAAIGTAVMLTGKSSGTADNDKAAASASAAAATASAAASASVATNDTPAPSATETASAATAPAAPSDSSTAEQKTASNAPSPPKETHESAPHESAPHESAPRPAAPKEAPAAAAGGSDQPFNMGEAKASLGNIANGLQSCKRGDTAGTGRVVVTFAPNGSVQSASVQGPPFEGTPTGGCVAAHFRGAHVPAFSGSPFSVSKHFTIN